MVMMERTGKEKTGILGGAFNPIHFGHLRTAEEVKEALSLDEVIFVPSYNPPFEKRSLAQFRDRLNMVRIATRDNPSFSVSDIESRLKGKSYSIRTVDALTREYGRKLYFIMGTDAFAEFPNWFNPRKIVETVNMVVVLRPPYDVESFVNNPFIDNVQCEKLRSIESRRKVTIKPAFGRKHLIFLRTTPLDVSSTNIRIMLKKGRSVNYLLPQKVQSYIISKELYS
jgi:nicotinate-nucleotide adenylyltransferase